MKRLLTAPFVVLLFVRAAAAAPAPEPPPAPAASNATAVAIRCSDYIVSATPRYEPVKMHRLGLPAAPSEDASAEREPERDFSRVARSGPVLTPSTARPQPPQDESFRTEAELGKAAAAPEPVLRFGATAAEPPAASGWGWLNDGVGAVRAVQEHQHEFDVERRAAFDVFRRRSGLDSGFGTGGDSGTDSDRGGAPSGE